MEWEWVGCPASRSRTLTLLMAATPLPLRMLIISFDAMWCSIRLSLQMADTLVSSLEREIQASWLINA